MSADVIPPADADFDALQGPLIKKVTDAPGSYDHSPADVERLTAAQSLWSPAYAKHQEAQIDAATASKAKNEARAGLEAELRSSIRKVNAMPTVTNATRVSLGIAAHAETRTPIAAPTTRPIGRIVDKGGHRQELHWVDEMTPHSRKKPSGVHACQLWLKIGDTAPVEVKGCELASLDTASPYLYEFEPGDAGKTAHWLLRWVSTRGEEGPLGGVVSGKINP